ncbi:MAG TPA: cupin domain-containing protein [Chloroflexota bacterium]|jgi:quercetin dioxygenase-like cupin family protein
MATTDDPGGPRGEGYYVRRQRQAAERRAQERQAPDVIDGTALPRENSPQGMLTHTMNPEISPKFHSAEAYVLEIEPGGYSGKHRHMSEEFLYVLEGSGYDLHWEVEPNIGDVSYEWQIADTPERHDWKTGDCIFIPVNTAHQHFNASPDQPVRLYSVTSRVYSFVGFPEWEQYETASSYQGGA